MEHDGVWSEDYVELSYWQAWAESAGVPLSMHELQEMRDALSPSVESMVHDHIVTLMDRKRAVETGGPGWQVILNLDTGHCWSLTDGWVCWAEGSRFDPKAVAGLRPPKGGEWMDAEEALKAIESKYRR